jgi:hypothetical protein
LGAPRQKSFHAMRKSPNIVVGYGKRLAGGWYGELGQGEMAQ